MVLWFGESAAGGRLAKVVIYRYSVTLGLGGGSRLTLCGQLANKHTLIVPVAFRAPPPRLLRTAGDY